MLPRALLRVLAVGSPALALAAALQLLTPPLTAVEPVLATARAGSGQVLSVTAPTATGTPQPAATPTAAPTDAPTPAPTPEPTAQPTVAPAAPVATPAAPPPATAPPAPPPPPRSRLVSADGRVDTGVGVYSDCSGRTDVPRAYAAIDTCVGGGRTYFVGHNPGVFTPLLSETVGSVITWWDAGGAAHRLQIVARRDWLRDDGVPPPVSGAVIAQFQTCLVPDGSKDLILDAVAA